VTPRLTIFTASVRLDLARLWLACVTRAFPREGTRVEIFDDSEDGALRPELLPGAAILRPGPGRRDFQEAYNDVLARTATPWLAFLDTDVFAVSPDVWPRVRARLETGAAAVLCAPQTAVEGHDTVAIALNVEAYRAALVDAPGGFLPRVEGEDPAGRPGRWRGFDTGDLLTGAVTARGGRVEPLRLEGEGAFVRFDALTNAHLLAAWAGTGRLLDLVRHDAYLREGCLGNIALRRIHDRTFPGGPPFAFPVSGLAVWSALVSAGPAVLRAGLGRARRLHAGARRLSRFLSASPRI
jgi:hypothetical protein